jgi:hypothetical protein
MSFQDTIQVHEVPANLPPLQHFIKINVAKSGIEYEY